MTLQGVCPILFLYNIIRLLGRVYNFSLLICYSCSFYFHDLMLVAHQECKLPSLSFTMQSSRRSVKANQSFGSTGSSLSTGFQVYLSKCWDPYVSPGVTIRLAFFCRFSALFQHVDFVTTSIRDGFQVYLSQPWVLFTQTKAVPYDLLGVESQFRVLCFFVVNCLGEWNQ